MRIVTSVNIHGLGQSSRVVSNSCSTKGTILSIPCATLIRLTKLSSSTFIWTQLILLGLNSWKSPYTYLIKFGDVKQNLESLWLCTYACLLLRYHVTQFVVILFVFVLSLPTKLSPNDIGRGIVGLISELLELNVLQAFCQSGFYIHRSGA